MLKEKIKPNYTKCSLKLEKAGWKKRRKNNNECNVEKTVTNCKQQSVSIIILNVNNLNMPTKRQELAEWIKKARLKLYVVYRNPL